jgi:hypothetical protein
LIRFGTDVLFFSSAKLGACKLGAQRRLADFRACQFLLRTMCNSLPS